MTAAQKTAKAKFKQAIAYRQKTGVSLKEAFAHIYGRKVGAVKKKIINVLKISDIKPGIEIININNPQWGSYKVDRKYDKGIWEITNNRGTRILDEAEAKFWKKLPSKLTFLSGQKKVGALPVGFKGSIYDIGFKIVNQYDIYNDVSAIMEDTNTGNRIVTFDGKGSPKDKAEAIVSYISKVTNIQGGYRDDKQLYSRMLKFATNMQKEVKDFNAGKKKTIKKEPLKILAPKKNIKMPIKKKKVVKKSAPKKKAAKKVVRKVVKKKAAPKKKVAKKKLTRKDYDKRFQADKPGKRTSASGNTYYEYRENRSDRGKLLGIGNVEDKMFKDLYNVRDKIANTKQAILKLQGYKNIVPFSQKYAYTKKINEYKKYLKEIVTHYRELKKYI